MTVMNYSNARKNFKGLIDKVNDDQEAVTITTGLVGQCHCCPPQTS